jgi:ATP-dependent helicase/nuclease subunit B
LNAEPLSSHFNDQRWLQLTQDMVQALQERACPASECVVLVPYAQLMGTARQAWVTLARQQGDAALLLPRVETTQNWATSLWASRGGFAPGPEDLRGDAAFDLLTAGQWLAHSQRGAQREILAPKLMEAAWSLARVAAAVPPPEREAWRERLLPLLTAGLSSSVLEHEAMVAQLALLWASSSAFATDVLFAQKPALLVVLEGFQQDPLADALRLGLGERAMSLVLAAPSGPRGRVALQATTDAAQEAERAAACVIDLLSRQVQPVGLIAQDRVLTRRVRALLAEQRVAVRDETGWTLSTTRAAAVLMSLLRALPHEASCDAVLDWLKHASAIEADQLQAAEAELRAAGVKRWASVRAVHAQAQALAQQVQPWLSGLQKSRPLGAWLAQLRGVLRLAGQWDALLRDVAGQAVCDALRLHDGSEADFDALQATLSRREFAQWVSQTLESASYSPVHPPQAQVVILPLSQVLGRSLAAMVLPGADEVSLPASPEPPGPWTSAQRLLLGLPSRSQLMAANRAAWNHALQLQEVHLLWRQSHNGEHLMPAAWVQELVLGGVRDQAADMRQPRELAVHPIHSAAALGARLPVTRLSASAYADLRSCPYRFFALRQLGLKEADELDSALGKRDFGNWLHETLSHFHLSLHAAPTADAAQRLVLMEAAAEHARRRLDLEPAEFLPFEAVWPQVRQGYLAWLAEHEAAGLVFAEAEEWKEQPLGELTLFGKIDRMDRDAHGRPQLLDYKTEGTEKTRERLKSGAEDTQLAFYAALLGETELSAAYVNVGEKGETHTWPQKQVLELRALLQAGIAHDVARLHAGEPLRALGDGLACEYCQARGLCRKDFVALQGTS